jgi:hypothetical protein
LYNWLNRDRDLEIRTLAMLSRNPFNKVRFLVLPKWMVFNRVDPPLFPYVQPQPGKFDLGRFDPEFFAHYESRIRDLAALGIEADIILFHPYDKWGFSRMDQRHDDAYLATFAEAFVQVDGFVDTKPLSDCAHYGDALKGKDYANGTEAKAKE